MAYKNLDAITESRTFLDYTDIFLKLQDRNMSFSQLKEHLSLSDNILLQIQEKKPLSFEDEQKIKEYLDIKTGFFKKEYYFDYPLTQGGASDKWKAIELFEKLKAHNFTILVDKVKNGENKYKLLGNVNGDYYEKEETFAYDTSAIIVLASYIKDSLN